MRAVLNHFLRFLLYPTFLMWFVCILLGSIAERLRPVQSRSQSWTFNVCYTGMMAWFTYLLTPIVGASVAFAFSHLRGGWIHLPPYGLGAWFSVLVLLASKDFLDYWIHRAQHRFSWLWRMHSFHHSDPAMNVSTAQRHYWLDRAFLTVAVYPLLAVVFSITPTLAFGLSFGTLFWSFFPHMNLRLSLGRLSWLVLGPQVHRLHHSALPEHFNCNYAGIFPVWDLIFGTYRKPGVSEFPATGLAQATPPTRIIDALIWPLKQ
jgi:sterol desaturase/sphingolipid hydroxylase (fatty acid hydroxylase superfamily)